MVTNTYPSVKSTCHSTYTCLHWRTKHLSGAVPHPTHNIYTCTPASTPGTTAQQRLRKELTQMQGGPARFRCSTVVRRKRSVNAEWPKTCSISSYRLDCAAANARSSALVRSQSTWSKTHSDCWPWRWSTRPGSNFFHFRGWHQL